MHQSNLTEAMGARGVPPHLHGGIADYIQGGVRPGGFLYAVLANDLREAVAYADHQSAAGLVKVVRFLTWDVPSICWGSKERVEAWIARRQP